MAVIIMSISMTGCLGFVEEETVKPAEADDLRFTIDMPDGLFRSIEDGWGYGVIKNRSNDTIQYDERRDVCPEHKKWLVTNPEGKTLALQKACGSPSGEGVPPPPYRTRTLDPRETREIRFQFQDLRTDAVSREWPSDFVVAGEYSLVLDWIHRPAVSSGPASFALED